MQSSFPRKKLLLLAMLAAGQAMAAPSVTLLSPVNGQGINKINQNAFPLHGTCSTINQDVTVSVPGTGLVATGKCEVDYTFTAAINLGTLPDGAASLAVSHTDGLGNSAQTSVSLVKDTSAANTSQVDCSPLANPLKAPSSLPYVGNTINSDGLGPYQRNPLQYVNKMDDVGPLNDTLNLAIPTDLPNQPLLTCGYIDVTKAPYNADPSGQLDSTDVINAAIKKAYESQLALWFPPGNYRVSNTLECAQGYYVRSSGSSSGPNYNNIQADISGCTLVGSRAGPQRARIILAPNSPGYNNPTNGNQKSVLHIWARAAFSSAPKSTWPSTSEPDVAYNDTISNIDVRVGSGNPGAVGVWFPAAQGSGISEMSIDVTNGYSGIQGAQGAGGGTHGVKIKGGLYGLDYFMQGVPAVLESQPAPTVSDIELTDQTVSAIRYQGLGTLTVVGSKITVPDNATGPAILAYTWSGSSMNGYLNLIDSQIIYAKSPAKTSAIVSNRATYIKNSYIWNANIAFATAGWDGGVTPKTVNNAINGQTNGWTYISEYANDLKPPVVTDFQYRDAANGNAWTKINLNYTTPVYLDGVKTPGPFSAAAPVYGQQPPGDHLSKHHFAGVGADFAMPGTVSVRQYGAVGDGVSDDTAAIQAALNANPNGNVFFPRGMYKVSDTLRPGTNTHMFGVSNSFTTLFSDGNKFINALDTVPMIETENSVDANPTLASMQLYVPLSSTKGYALNWRSGGANAAVYDVMFRLFSRLSFVNTATGDPLDHALVKISGNGGGKWYNFVTNNYTNVIWGSWKANPKFRQLLITGTSRPLSIYQLDAEYTVSDAMVEINSATNVDIYGLKSEGNYAALWVNGSDHISVYGHGGNATALPKNTSYFAASTYSSAFSTAMPSLYRVESTPNFRLVNSVDQGYMTNSATAQVQPGANPVVVWYTPDHWIFINDLTNPATPLQSAAWERPVLFKRGNPK